jgi:membrane protein DedA with SNARE-associated domain/rhodanese-related sulfurtransferase
MGFLLRHPYAVLFALVFAEQIGLPLPALPFLLGAGALAGMGMASGAVALAMALLACLLADVVWFEAGRRRGASILNLLCRISIEPDSCVRRTENVFARYGARTLLVAKFVPGLGTVAPPLAGVIGMALPRFLLWDAAGAVLWAGGYLTVGFVFRDQIETAVEVAAGLGSRLTALIALLFVGWLAWKWHDRRRFIRNLRTARITVDELKDKLDAGESVLIVDLRAAIEVATSPATIPGALHFEAEQLGARHHEIPRDRDIVLFCTCPNEATSARVALQLRSRGITRVRPLVGGLAAWRSRGFAVSAPEAPAAA